MKITRVALATFIAATAMSTVHGDCLPTLDRYASLIDASGGVVEVLVFAEPDCSCHPSGDSNWITITSDSSKYPHVAFVECAPNLNGPKREAIVSVGGTCHRVIQAGGVAGTMHCWGGNTYGQCDVPPDDNAATAVAAGEWSTTALRPDGTVSRWGLGSSVPSGLQGVLLVSSNHAVSQNGQVHSLVGTAVPEAATDVVEVVDGWLHTVALRADGTVVCWGDNSIGQCNVPPDLGPVLAVAAGRVSSAALTIDGTVREWGETYGIEPPADMPPVLRVVKGWSHTVADTGSFGLRIWGSASWAGDAMSGFRNDAYPVRQLTAGRAATLAIDTTIHLWGTHPDAGDVDLNALGPPLDAAVGSEHGVILTSDVACATVGWGTGGATLPSSGGLLSLTFERNGISCDFEPEVLNAEWLSLVSVSENDRIVTVDVMASPTPTTQRRSAVVRLGNRSVRVVQFPETEGRWFITGFDQQPAGYPGDLSEFVQIEVGYGHVIARRADGTVVGWGNNHVGQASPPADLGPAVDIAAGQAHSVALLADGTVRCWGWNCCGQTSVPANLPPAIDIAASFNATSVVLANGQVRCWGEVGAEPCSASPAISNVFQIASGLNHFVGLRNDGTVAAWGLNHAQQTSVPKDLGEVSQVAAGLNHSLALLSDGTVRAWGFAPTGESAVPESLSGVIQIAAGGEPLQQRGYSAALLANGTIVAWGDGSYGSLSLPTDLGPVTGISSRYRELVARRDTCPADLTADGRIDGADISVVLGFWGLDPGPYPAADITGDGFVNGADLAQLLGSWGECP